MRKILFTLTVLTGANGVFAQEMDINKMTKEELKEAYETLMDLSSIMMTELQEMDSCKYAHEKYLFSEAINNDTTWKLKSPWSFMDIIVLSAVGDRNSQNVTVELLLSNTAINQKVYIDAFGAEAVDAIGKASALTTINVGTGKHFGTIFTDVPVRVRLIFSGVISGTEKFNLVGFKMSSIDENSKSTPEKKQVEIRNIAIEW